MDQVSVSVVVYKDILGSQEKDSIVNTTMMAAGTKADLISVECLPKYEERVVEEENDTQTSTDTVKEGIVFGLTLIELAIIGGGIILLLIILMIVVGIIKHKKKKKRKLAELEAEKIAKEQAEAMEIQKLGEEQPETKEAAIRREIGEFAESSPEVAAQLLKSWLREDGGK